LQSGLAFTSLVHCGVHPLSSYAEYASLLLAMTFVTVIVLGAGEHAEDLMAMPFNCVVAALNIEL
jgi:hypothetical protein